MTRLTLALLLLVTAPLALADSLKDPLGEPVKAADLARCAGVYDSMFAGDWEAGDAEFLDEYASTAHIFFSLARAVSGGEQAATLHILRTGTKAQVDSLPNPDAKHVFVQACSDLHQAIVRQGRFKDPALK